MVHYTDAIARNNIESLIRAASLSRKCEMHDKARVWYAYPNIAIAADTETSSFWVDSLGRTRPVTTPRNGDNPGCCMYIWMLAIRTATAYISIYGRTLAEYDDCINWLASVMTQYERDLIATTGKRTNLRLAIYYHNLAFDYAFVHRDSCDNMFALKVHRPCKVNETRVIEYRCSYLATNLSLDSIGKTLGCPKLTGWLDYNLIRTPETPLTDAELAYCERDVEVLSLKIDKMIGEEKTLHKVRGGGMATIPVTSTSYIRRACRTRLKKSKSYMDTIHNMTMTSDMYKVYRDSFRGGHTHANRHHAGKRLGAVDSADIRSSYPAIMTTHKMPMGPATYYPTMDRATYESLLSKDYIAFATVTYTDIIQTGPDAYLANVRDAKIRGDYEMDNGKIIRADGYRKTMDNVEYDTIAKLYDYDDVEITDVYVHKAEYLPTELVVIILDYFAQKTELKGNDAMVDIYNLSKTYINGIYGMSATDPVRAEIDYDGHTYTPKMIDLGEAIDNYNDSESRILSYAWASLVTSWARHKLVDGIIAAGRDYVYSDTDSVKYLRNPAVDAKIAKLSADVLDNIQAAAQYHGLPIDKWTPISPEEGIQIIGTWDTDDAHYDEFKTLGAKRYVFVSKKKGFGITVAGVNKLAGAEWIKKEATRRNVSPLEVFRPHMVLPVEMIDVDGVPTQVGKVQHHYCDPATYDVTDYQGNTCRVTTRGGIALYASPYTMGVSESAGALYTILSMMRDNA